MSIFADFAASARPAVTAAATAFVQDRTGRLNLERLSAEAELSRNAPLGSGTPTAPSAELSKLAGEPGYTRFLMPVAIGVGLLVLVIALKGK